MYLFELDFSPDIRPGVGLLDHMVTLLVVFFFNLFLFGCVGSSLLHAGFL